MLMIAEIESKDRLVSIAFDIDQIKLILSVHDLYAGTPTCKYGVDGAIAYRTCYGTWKYSCTGKWYFADIGSTHWRQATIREFIKDDMTDAWKYAVSAVKERQFADINKEIQESIREKCGVPPEYYMERRPLVIDDMNIGEQETYEDYKKKGGNEMNKSLYHVILFNKKSEIIDFKGYIPAVDALDAGMVAAQSYGTFAPNLHLTIIKKIDNSGYDKVE